MNTSTAKTRTGSKGRATPAKPQIKRTAPGRAAPAAASRLRERQAEVRGNRGFGAVPMLAMLIFGVVAGFWIGFAFQKSGLVFAEKKVVVQTYRPPPNSSFTF